MLRAGCGVDADPQRLAALEQFGQIQREERGCQGTQVVVGRQQLEDPRDEAEGHKAGEERIRGECRLPRGLASWSKSPTSLRHMMLTVFVVLQGRVLKCGARLRANCPCIDWRLGSGREIPKLSSCTFLTQVLLVDLGP